MTLVSGWFITVVLGKICYFISGRAAKQAISLARGQVSEMICGNPTGICVNIN